MTASCILPVRMIDKVWGVDRLPPPFAMPDGRRIGEIWFDPPPELARLLVKYLFTSEKLSVQVHPSAADGQQGKEECWLVLSAEPGAQLAIGFVQPITPDEMRAAALDGSIEGLLDWQDVSAGDFIYLPAGTVHAIGAGLTLIEVQQNADITYRLFDYGRPRELHLDQAMAVANGNPHDPALRRSVPQTQSASLVDGPHFRLDWIVGKPDADIAARYNDAPVIVIPLTGTIEVGGEHVAPGSCASAGELSEVCFAPDGKVLIAQPL